MDAVHARLRRLRDWFLVWFVVEAAAGIAAAAYVLDGMSHHAVLRYATGGVGAAGTVFAGIVVSLGLLLLAWAMLEALQALRPWARMVVLIIGWITVVSAALDLLMLPVQATFVESVAAFTGGDWRALVATSALTKLADLLFWGYTIHTLQANPAVREAFAGRAASPAGGEPTCQGKS